MIPTLNQDIPIPSTAAKRPWLQLRFRQIAMLAVAAVFLLAKLADAASGFFVAYPHVKQALIASSAAAGLTALGALGFCSRAAFPCACRTYCSATAAA